jgi:hypothetical protein
MPAPTLSTEPREGSFARPSRPVPSRSMPDFVPFQFCKLVAAPPTGEGWMHEVKFDGYRMQLRMAKGRARWRTRNLFEWTEKFARDVGRSRRTCPMGSMTASFVPWTPRAIPNFSTLKSDIQRGALDRLVFFSVRRALARRARSTRLCRCLSVDTDLSAALWTIWILPPTIRLVEPLPGSGPRPASKRLQNGS